MDDRLRYDRSPISADELTSHGAVVRLVGSGKRVLDLGCGPGIIAQALAEHECRVTGVDAEATNVERAREFCEAVLVVDLDLESDQLKALKAGPRYDAILAADVLEHLKEPGTVLEQLKELLDPTGVLIVSLPNATHGSVRAKIMGGQFEYEDEGILDRTHLKFYTLATATEFFIASGFDVVAYLPIVNGVTTGSLRGIDGLAGLSDSIVEEIVSDEESHAFQWIFVLQERGSSLMHSDIAAAAWREALSGFRHLVEARSRAERNLSSDETLFGIGEAPAMKAWYDLLQLQDSRLASMGASLRELETSLRLGRTRNGDPDSKGPGRLLRSNKMLVAAMPRLYDLVRSVARRRRD